jgi:hypothetical protein
MVAGRWFLSRNKEKVGPFSAGELRQLARVGILQPADNVWLEGAQKWLTASAVPGLFPPPTEKKYWLALGGQAHGPFIADQIRAGLNTHQFKLDTAACTDAERRWTRLGDLPDFRDFKLDTDPLTPSRAQLLTRSLEFEEAALYLAGKGGDIQARLIATFMEMKRNYAHNPALVESIDYTIAVLKAKREEEKVSVPEAPQVKS